MITKKALAYYRTSSATNVGNDKDSRVRQEAAVEAYAKANGIEIVESFYDKAIKGSDSIESRPEFAKLLLRLASNGIDSVLVEDPTRFARDLMVQLVGHKALRDRNVELIPVNAPDYFTNETPTATLVQQVLGAIAEFEKASLVARLAAARKRKGRLGAATPVPEKTIALARKLSETPDGHKRRSLRTIAKLLAEKNHRAPSGRVYGAQSVKAMLAASGHGVRHDAI